MGHRPLAPVRIGYEFTYLYLALCPFTGEGYAAFLPTLDGESYAWFVAELGRATGQPALLIADGATAHKASFFREGNLRQVKLPAACPELNPVERFFKAVRARLKFRVFDCLDQARQAVQTAVESVADTAEKTISLTCFPYLTTTTSSI